MNKYITIIFVTLVLGGMAILPVHAQLKVRDNGHIYVGDSMAYLYYYLTINGYTGFSWENSTETTAYITPGYTESGEDEYDEATEHPARIAATDICFYPYNSNNTHYLKLQDILYLEYDGDNYLSGGSNEMTAGLGQVLSLVPAKTNGLPLARPLQTEDIERISPHIVRTTSEGRKMISTKGIITLLAQACRQLSAQEKALEAAITNLESSDIGSTRSKGLVAGLDNMESLQEARLYGNSPNPFARTTSLHMYIPEETTQALLRITGTGGQMVQETTIADRREVKYVIDGSQWARGVYFASLIVDGVIVNTVKLTKK